MTPGKSKWIYGALFGLFVLFILLRELVWRFTSPFSMDIHGMLTNGSDSVSVTIHESTDTPVDSVREEFGDPRSGKTSVRVIPQSHASPLSFVATGHYYSSAVPLTFSEDHARELFLIPSTEQGLPLGLGELIYLDTSGNLNTLHIESRNMGDVDSDGVYEIYDNFRHTFLHLNRASRNWQPVELRRK